MCVESKEPVTYLFFWILVVCVGYRNCPTEMQSFAKLLPAKARTMMEVRSTVDEVAQLSTKCVNNCRGPMCNSDFPTEFLKMFDVSDFNVCFS